MGQEFDHSNFSVIYILGHKIHDSHHQHQRHACQFTAARRFSIFVRERDWKGNLLLCAVKINQLLRVDLSSREFRRRRVLKINGWMFFLTIWRETDAALID